jgi:hypothetical protein
MKIVTDNYKGSLQNLAKFFPNTNHAPLNKRDRFQEPRTE